MFIHTLYEFVLSERVVWACIRQPAYKRYVCVEWIRLLNSVCPLYNNTAMRSFIISLFVTQFSAGLNCYRNMQLFFLLLRLVRPDQINTIFFSFRFLLSRVVYLHVCACLCALAIIDNHDLLSHCRCLKIIANYGWLRHTEYKEKTNSIFFFCRLFYIEELNELIAVAIKQNVTYDYWLIIANDNFDIEKKAILHWNPSSHFDRKKTHTHKKQKTSHAKCTKS